MKHEITGDSPLKRGTVPLLVLTHLVILLVLTGCGGARGGSLSATETATGVPTSTMGTPGTATSPVGPVATNTATPLQGSGGTPVSVEEEPTFDLPDVLPAEPTATSPAEQAAGGQPALIFFSAPG